MAGEWQPTTLGAIADFLSGGTPSKANPSYWTGTVPWLSAKDMKEFRVSDTQDHLSAEGAENGTKLVPAGTPFLLTRGMTLLNDVPISVAQREMAFNQDVKALSPRPGVRTDYLAYLLLSLKPQLLEMVDLAGHGTGRLNTDELKAIRLEIPAEDDEQRAIAHILGTLDDNIELNRRMNETLEAIARAIFKSWFVDFDPVRAKASGEPPESICRRLGLTPDILALFPDRLVDSELGEIPEGWERITLGSIASVTKGKSYKSSELGPSDTALVTLKSFNRGGGYRLDGLKEYTGSFRSEQEVFAGELIVAYTDVTQAADVVGKPALILSDSRYKHLVISLDVAVVRSTRPEYRPFLYGLMSEDAFQQHTRAHTTGTTVLHLAAGAVPGFVLAWPGDGLIDAYSALAQPLFELIDSRVGENRSLGSVRDTLLPKLLSGELRVPVEGAA